MKRIPSLQSPHPDRTPAEVLESLATEWEALDIESFDIYCDFTSYKA
jgi:hypothetical protein